VGWCPDGDFLAIFSVLYFQRAARSTFHNLHSGGARVFAARGKRRHIQNAGLKRAARGWLEMRDAKKITKNSPSGHRTTL